MRNYYVTGQNLNVTSEQPVHIDKTGAASVNPSAGSASENDRKDKYVNISAGLSDCL